MDMQHHGEIMVGQKYLFEGKGKLIDRAWNSKRYTTTSSLYIYYFYVLQCVVLQSRFDKKSGRQ